MAEALRRPVLVLIALLALVVGIDNLERPLAHPDEGRYSEIAREMVQSGDWVTPRLNGFKYLEKPPLQYWATALAFGLFGETEFAARLYAALCALLILGAVGFTMRRLASQAEALLAVGVLLASPYFLALAGVVTLDMGLTAWLTVAVCAFLLAQAPGPQSRERRRWILLAWAAVALAVLSKGLVGIVFPAAAIVLHCLLHRDWRLLTRLEWARGSALFLAIAAPWFVLVALANPEFTRFFFVHEHFERFLTTSHRRREPAWYFLPILLIGFLPWMLALVPAIAQAWKADQPRRVFPWRRFVLLWSGFIVLFFSASGSKLPTYVLPAFPLLAMVLAGWIARTEPRRLALYLAPVVLVVVVALAIGWRAPERAYNPWMRDLYLAARPWIAAGGLLLAVGYAAAAWMLRRGEKLPALVVVVTVTLAFVDAAEDGYEELSPRQSGAGVAAVMLPHVGEATRVYSVDQYDQTVPFYLRRTVTLVAYADEFALGQRSEPGRALPDKAAFLADWGRPGRAVAIMQPGYYDELARSGFPMTLLLLDERRAVVVKP